MMHQSYKFIKGLLRCGCLLLLLLMGACSDDLATSPDDQPDYSTDTLRLGTILAGNSSMTYQLMLYNRNSDELRLSSIVLRDAETSGFRMNVDGMNGTSFTESDLLRIAAGDSMYVFVEATFPTTGEGVKTHRDYIDVLCNGKVSTVVLEAVSKDVLKWEGKVLTEDKTFLCGQEIQIYDSLVIAEGVTLTLEDSVTVYLHDKADIVVYGKMMANGKPGAPVVIRGDRTDKMFDNLPYDNLPAQWGTCYIKESSYGNVLNHVEMRGMTDGIRIEAADLDTTLNLADEYRRLVVRNSRLRLSSGNLITGYFANILIENSELAHAAGSLLELYGGVCDVVHTTLANYHFASAIDREAVHFTNYDTLTQMIYPLYRCEFTNTLIWGDTYTPDVYPDYYRVIDGETGVELDSVFHYRFDHCLLRAEGFDDEDFIKIVWNQDPCYYLIDDPNYTYDFRLREGSPALGAGNPSGAQRCPYDLNGLPRPQDAAPTIGCYEGYVSPPADASTP